MYYYLPGVKKIAVRKMVGGESGPKEPIKVQAAPEVKRVSEEEEPKGPVKGASEEKGPKGPVKAPGEKGASEEKGPKGPIKGVRRMLGSKEPAKGVKGPKAPVKGMSEEKGPKAPVKGVKGMSEEEEPKEPVNGVKGVSKEEESMETKGDQARRVLIEQLSHVKAMFRKYILKQMSEKVRRYRYVARSLS